MKTTNHTKSSRTLFAPKKKFTCPNCLAVLEKGEGHFFPPCFGEEGFFVCDKPEFDPPKTT